ncbi:Ribosomal protein S12 methylthiotransferase RimO [uncultured Eubacterium sp.]|uniref:30S ribosomal protein S12 methylthiotransferase RimO n=1 Tax=Brotomerdimonas butyrica TaxID=2981721 RepID=UPI00082218F2|nr:30S ribosomal protein S12 methylthiotransferase RimO [Brotomerdimonas butyrica]MCU6756229.1 30S ribosomal protein S12 methylthiotransferase RimO [Brotomerdimonas butyrica]SCH73270.1 Ribosomal protein S12 methylthiotransferase RimO [uncultured Eubacterium sp.]
MKLYIETMGCPKNFNDSESIGGIWESTGMSLTDDPAEADAILVNTCGFINDAKQESIGCIFDMARFIDESAKQAPDHEKKILIVSGCLSQRYGKELADEMPEVDIFLGVNDYEKLPQLVKEYRKGKRLQAFSCQPDAFYEFSARKIKDNPYSMTLRIAEGCNNCCAYCVIPQIRGAYRSRPMENIIEEAELLASKGCREIILIAQDVTEYGTDIYGRLMLPELLRKLCRVDGIRWIRLMYCYEDKITDELIEVMASEEKICDYIDIPLQHVSDGVLSAMNRHSTTESIKDTLGRLRTVMPDIHIRTTLITGFPGETEEEFEELLEFVEETRFERLGVFAYSREEGTVAGDMENQIDEDVKAMRADAIMRRQLDISREINESKVGDTMTVMVDGTDEDGAYLGRTVYDAPEIDNTVIFTADEELVPGDMVQVKITDAFDYDLVGKMEG